MALNTTGSEIHEADRRAFLYGDYINIHKEASILGG